MYTKDMPYTLLYMYYYTDRLSIRLSVDPLADKYPHLSPYAYCADNPVGYIDPTGEFPIETIWDIVIVLYDVVAAVVNHIKGDLQAAKAIEKVLVLQEQQEERLCEKKAYQQVNKLGHNQKTLLEENTVTMFPKKEEEYKKISSTTNKR